MIEHSIPSFARASELLAKHVILKYISATLLPTLVNEKNLT